MMARVGGTRAGGEERTVEVRLPYAHQLAASKGRRRCFPLAHFPASAKQSRQAEAAARGGLAAVATRRGTSPSTAHPPTDASAESRQSSCTRPTS